MSSQMVSKYSLRSLRAQAAFMGEGGLPHSMGLHLMPETSSALYTGSLMTSSWMAGDCEVTSKYWSRPSVTVDSVHGVRQNCLPSPFDTNSRLGVPVDAPLAPDSLLTHFASSGARVDRAISRGAACQHHVAHASVATAAATAMHVTAASCAQRARAPRSAPQARGCR